MPRHRYLYLIILLLLVAIGTLVAVHVLSAAQHNRTQAEFLRINERNENTIAQQKLNLEAFGNSSDSMRPYMHEYRLYAQNNPVPRALVTSYTNGFQLLPFSDSWSCGLSVDSHEVICQKIPCDKEIEVITGHSLPEACGANLINDPVPRYRLNMFTIKLSTLDKNQYASTLTMMQESAQNYATPRGREYFVTQDENGEEIISYFSTEPINILGPYQDEGANQYGKYVISNIPYSVTEVVLEEELKAVEGFIGRIIDNTLTVASKNPDVIY